MNTVCCIDSGKGKLANCRGNQRLFGLSRQNFSLLASAFTDTLTDSASAGRGLVRVHGVRPAEGRRESKSDIWRAGRSDDRRTGQTCRTDAARRGGADSNGSPKPKAIALDSACERVKRPAKPICRRPRQFRIGAATVSANSSKPFRWSTGGWCNAGQTPPVPSPFLKPTMAGHSPALTLQFDLLFS
jgi:hypothetical protein